MERDFQDGATGMNKIAFCNFCDEKRPEREAELKGFTPSPLPPPPPGPTFLFFHFSVSEDVLFLVNSNSNSNNNNRILRNMS